jgi:hypothetical protein
VSRRIVAALSSIFLLFSAFSSQALTPQTTRNVINGSAPYLTFDGGFTRATNSDELLSITLPGGTRIMPSTNPSNASNPIELQYPNKRFTDIGMYVPPNTRSVALSTLVASPYNYWGDDDGDGQGSGGISATGSLTLSIVDKAGHAVDRRDILTHCKAPYKITLSSTSGTLSTRYGFPKSRNFTPNSVIYYIKPTGGSVCSAMPYLWHGSNDEPGWPNTEFAGPGHIWNPNMGFITQSTEPSHYHLNFPTTGAHGLFFVLDITGSREPLTWAPVTHSGITATMRSDPSGASVLVTLTGPNGSTAGHLPRPSLPATFELVGRDSRGREVTKYGFVLKQWFVGRDNNYYNYYESLSWCNNIGYHMPRVRDLTNSQCLTPDCQGAISASPHSSGENYQRNINAGLLAEWGILRFYDTNIIGGSGSYFWTSDAKGSEQLIVNSYDGIMASFQPYRREQSVICVSSLRP